MLGWDQIQYTRAGAWIARMAWTQREVRARETLRQILARRLMTLAQIARASRHICAICHANEETKN